MSPAQIESICKKAALRALKRDIETGCGGIIHSDIVKSIEEEEKLLSERGRLTLILKLKKLPCF